MKKVIILILFFTLTNCCIVQDQVKSKKNSKSKISLLKKWVSNQSFSETGKGTFPNWPRYSNEMPLDLFEFIKIKYGKNKKVRNQVAYFIIKYEYHVLISGYLTINSKSNLKTNLLSFFSEYERINYGFSIDGSPSIRKFSRWIWNNKYRFGLNAAQKGLMKINEINHDRLIEYKSGNIEEFRPLKIDKYE